MKVYIVTSGSYSDYRICEVFSTKEKAEAYIAKFDSAWDFNEIEDWEVDDGDRAVKYLRVSMNVNGDTLWFNKECDLPENISKDVFFVKRARDGSEAINVEVVTEDKKRAVKVTNEIRTELIAMNIWGDQKAIDSFIENRKRL